MNVETLDRVVRQVATQVRWRRAEHYGLRGAFYGALAALAVLIFKQTLGAWPRCPPRRWRSWSSGPWSGRRRAGQESPGGRRGSPGRPRLRSRRSSGHCPGVGGPGGSDAAGRRAGGRRRRTDLRSDPCVRSSVDGVTRGQLARPPVAGGPWRWSLAPAVPVPSLRLPDRVNRARRDKAAERGERGQHAGVLARPPQGRPEAAIDGRARLRAARGHGWLDDGR